MKRALLVGLGVLFSLGAGLIARAQDSVYSINIPFAFYIGDQQLPAGTYYLESKRQFDGSQLSFESIHRSGEARVLLPSASTLMSGEQTTTPKLIFKQYGNVYFLSQYWGGHGEGKQLVVSSMERELASKQVSQGLAIAAR